MSGGEQQSLLYSNLTHDSNRWMKARSALSYDLSFTGGKIASASLVS